jgi:hypothetical protein
MHGCRELDLILFIKFFLNFINYYVIWLVSSHSSILQYNLHWGYRLNW